jgi:hypothetical protein
MDNLKLDMGKRIASSYDVFQDTVLENNVPMLSNKTL